MRTWLDKRNDAVFTGMVKTLKRYDTIIIPWGAMLMPAIEATVLDQGFAPDDVQERLSLDSLWGVVAEVGGENN